MQIAVLGLGRYGRRLAETLTRQGHEVIAVDTDEGVVEDLSEVVARAAIADITDLDALRDLGVGDVEAAVVSTAVLEASVLAMMNLQTLGVAPVHAKARSDRHATILRRLGAETVMQPERDGADRFAHLIQARGASDYLPLTTAYGVGLFPAPASRVGQQLELVADAEVGTRRLLMLVRGDEVQLNPVRSQLVEAEDLLVFAGSDRDLGRDL